MDDATLSPAESLRLIEEQRKAVFRETVPNPLFLFTPWGVAWLVGFTAYFLAYGLDRPPITWQTAFAVLMGANLLAGTTMVFGMTRPSLRIKGQSAQRGTMYGIAWFVGMVTMSWACSTFVPFLAENRIGMLFSVCSMMIVAMLYMAGGAIWLDWTMFFLGVWVAVVVSVAAAVGPSWGYLILAVLIGVPFLVTGIVKRHRA